MPSKNIQSEIPGGVPPEEIDRGSMFTLMNATMLFSDSLSNEDIAELSTIADQAQTADENGQATESNKHIRTFQNRLHEITTTNQTS